MIEVSIITFVWILFCANEGIYDALLYPDVRRPRMYMSIWPFKDIHIPHKSALFRRGLFGLALGLIIVWIKDNVQWNEWFFWIEGVALTIGLGLILPVFQTGFLNVIKRINEKRIDPNTSTFQNLQFFSNVRGWDGKWYIRVLMLVLGTVMIVLINFFENNLIELLLER